MIKKKIYKGYKQFVVILPDFAVDHLKDTLGFYHHEIYDVKQNEIYKLKPRKNKSKRTQIPLKVKEAVFEKDNYTCKCGVKATDVHHIIHQEDGGTHYVDNLISLCKKCHAEEHKGETVYNALISNI